LPALEYASPEKKAKKSYLETIHEKEEGTYVAVSDNMKLDQ
jgi:hypothetical protein